MLGPPGTGGLATLVDRKARFTIVVKIQSKDADHVHEKIKQRLKALDDEHCHSITFDNGTEFARCHRLEKHLSLKLYWADPTFKTKTMVLGRSRRENLMSAKTCFQRPNENSKKKPAANRLVLSFR